VNDTVPWEKASLVKNKTNISKTISQIQQTISLTDLSLNLPQCFKSFAKDLKSLEFTQRPDYSKLKAYFKQ